MISYRFVGTPSARSQSVPRSGIRRISDVARTLAGAIRLDIGDPMFTTPDHIIDAAARAARDGHTHYGPSVGLPSLRELLVEKVALKNGISADVDRIIVTPGGCGAILAAFLAVLDVGDSALVPDPGWPNYRTMLSILGARAIPYPLDAGRGFLPDPVDVIGRADDTTRLLVLNTPGNPTGAVLGAPELAALVEAAAERDLWLLSDECYDELSFDGPAFSAAAVGDSERVLTAFTFSKTYAMTGWRIGYLVAPKAVALAAARAQEPLISCPSTIAQKAAEAALTGPQDAVATMRDHYRSNRDAAAGVLDRARVGYVRPAGAFYMMVDVSRAGRSEDFADDLLIDGGVAVVPGTAFGNGGEGFARVALCGDTDQLVTGLQRLAAALAG
jgi:aspartate aminotransferase